MPDTPSPICVRSADRLTPGDVITIDGTSPDEVVRVIAAPSGELRGHVYIRTRRTAWCRPARELVAVVATHVDGVGYVTRDLRETVVPGPARGGEEPF